MSQNLCNDNYHNSYISERICFLCKMEYFEENGWYADLKLPIP